MKTFRILTLSLFCCIPFFADSQIPLFDKKDVHALEDVYTKWAKESLKYTFHGNDSNIIHFGYRGLNELRTLIVTTELAVSPPFFLTVDYPTSDFSSELVAILLEIEHYPKTEQALNGVRERVLKRICALKASQEQLYAISHFIYHFAEYRTKKPLLFAGFLQLRSQLDSTYAIEIEDYVVQGDYFKQTNVCAALKNYMEALEAYKASKEEIRVAEVNFRIGQLFAIHNIPSLNRIAAIYLKNAASSYLASGDKKHFLTCLLNHARVIMNLLASDATSKEYLVKTDEFGFLNLRDSILIPWRNEKVMSDKQTVLSEISIAVGTPEYLTSNKHLIYSILGDYFFCEQKDSIAFAYHNAAFLASTTNNEIYESLITLLRRYNEKDDRDNFWGCWFDLSLIANKQGNKKMIAVSRINDGLFTGREDVSAKGTRNAIEKVKSGISLLDSCDLANYEKQHFKIDAFHILSSFYKRLHIMDSSEQYENLCQNYRNEQLRFDEVQLSNIEKLMRLRELDSTIVDRNREIKKKEDLLKSDQISLGNLNDVLLRKTGIISTLTDSAQLLYSRDSVERIKNNQLQNSNGILDLQLQKKQNDLAALDKTYNK